MRLRSALLILALAGFPLWSQNLSDRFKESARGWELMLERGDGSGVRKAAEAMIQREAGAVSTTDYNDMRTLVALYDIAARAAVLDGAWEEAIAHLQRAVATATTNQEQAESTFGRIRKDHEAKLVEWRETITKYEKRIKELDEMPGLPESEVKTRAAIRASLEEHRNAVAHSEKSLKEIQALLGQIRSVRDVYVKSLLDWQAFQAREKEEMTQAGSPAKYVVDKNEQVKADVTKPKFERLAYARRLQKLDPANSEVAKLIQGLSGNEPGEADSKPEPKPRTKPAKRKKK